MLNTECLLLICIVFVVKVHAQSVSDTLTVQIDQGPVRGHRNGNIFTFLNVPYATAPTGPDRFKAPLPPPTWTSEFNAVNRFVFCPQVPPIFFGREDCLVANIFVPDTNATNLPVMVVVHGGAYYILGGDLMRFNDLVRTEKIIVVTFNYRLGAFGFLCLGTKDIPGNAGMKDQVELLRWVNRNIASFGGNPDDVTISGCSAGGGSVDLLSLSPMTRGLFKKVITNSGASLGALGAQMDPLENAKIYARALNFTNVDDIDALEEFYKTAPMQTFLQFSVPFDSASSMSFGPCVEADNGSDEERFLPDSPWSIIRNRNYSALPILYGFTDHESSLYTTQFDSTSAMMNSDFQNYLPFDLQFDSEQQREEVASAVKQFYFGDNPIDFDNLQNYLNYFTDLTFGYPILRTINHRRESNNDPIYLFKYSFVDDNTPFVLNSTIRGAAHCAQDIIVADFNLPNVTPEYLMMRDLMREVYLSFIISGQPSAPGLPDWAPVTGKWSPHMSLNNESALLQTSPLDNRADMWDDLFSKYSRHPVPPAIHVQEEPESLLVEIEQGLVRGHRDGEIYTFFNIPYATAPTGPHRFKAPLPPPRRTTEFDAVNRGVFCPQLPPLEHYQEDCLVANIFVPNTNATNLPVMVVVHGGAYIQGAGDFWRYTDLVRTEKIIVVTFNYRLGAFGFLCLGTKDIPGNAGMKDQVELLRWVNRNIASFGGNPDDVTISGCSAGGGSVDLLSLSPMTRGLFKKVITNSGASLGALGAQMDPLENAKIYARALNFTNVDDIDALEEFYKTAPMQTFLQFSVPFDSASSMSFSPCIEADNGSDEERFLPDSPWSIIRNRNYSALPILYGFTDYESSLYTTEFDSISAMMNSDFRNYLPFDLQFESEQQREEVASAVRQFYFGDNPIDFDNLQNYLNYFTDLTFGYPILRTINHRRESNNDPIYLFKYSFVDDNTPFILNSTIRGAEHCSQDIIVADHDITNVTPEHLMMRDLMREVYLSFIISGQPSAPGLPDWTPVTGKWSPHMSLNNESALLQTSPLDNRADMWDDLFSKYPRHPVPPATNVQEEPESLLVEIEQGLVRGHRDGEIYTFFNIPYATAPTGPHRFKAPLPPPRRTTEFDAVNRGVFCPQLPPLEHYQEDCLVANIFVPNTNATNLPVMVVVHGGAYIQGAGDFWRYTDLVRTEKIIVVTFNYRLGAFGFLCLGTKDIPGNAGMKDQVELLRWVNRNIASFGGNPDDVTISGCSAGGGSVDLLSLSPMTRGLFKKVITNSGASLGAIGAQMDPLENAKIYARALNFTNVDDIDALEEFYKTAPIETFLQFSVPFDSASSISFSPCVEADNGSDEERFLPDSPWSIIRNRNYSALPILYGFTDYESSLYTTEFDSISAMMNLDFRNYLPFDLQFDSEQQREEVASAVKQFYFGDNPIDFDNLQNYLNYFTDLIFAYPILRTINNRRESNNDPIYLFKYSFVDDNTPFVLNSTIRGAAHCSQDIIVADHDVTNVTPEHLMMRDLMREVYLSFIISGQPSASVGLTNWPPVSGKWSPYMALNNESTLVPTAPLAGRADMWDDLYSKHARHPLPPNPNAAVFLHIPSILTVICSFLTILYN